MAESTLKKLLRSYKLPEGFIPNSTLKGITDWGRLAEMWDKTSDNSVPRQLIEARMAEVLPTLLPGISEKDTLEAMSERTSYQSQAQKLIWARRIEVITSPGDWDELGMIWDNVRSTGVARKQVEVVMAGALPALLPDIQDWIVLAQMRDKTSYRSLANQLIEARMAEVLPTSLSGIDNWNRLAEMWDKTSDNSVPRIWIEARMAEVLPTSLPGITDWHELAEMQNKTSDDTEARSRIVARMKEVLPGLLLNSTHCSDLITAWMAVLHDNNFEQQFTGRMMDVLNTINDWVELVNIWSEASCAFFPIQACVEARIAGVVKNTNSWSQLEEIRSKTSPDSALRQQVLARRAELLPDLLLHIYEWDELVALWYASVNHSARSPLVEARMAQLISAVTTSHCPAWFPILLQHVAPNPIRPALDQKVAELRKELNITD